MMAKKPQVLFSILFAVLFLLTVVVGCIFTGDNGNSGKDVTLYERTGVTIAIPNEYADQLLIDPVEYDDESTLLRIYHKSTYEKYKGMGFLFSIARYTEAQYEQFLSSDGSGQSFFAKDDTFYYGFFFATDVQAPEDNEAFSQLFSAVGDYVKSDMITRNGLTAYSDDEFFNKPYTYDSEHIFLSYYPYYAYNGSKEEVWTLILSQPAAQGDTGIWCVERWKDQNGNIYPYFPDENGTPSAEYYAKRQAECDSGSDISWLDPKQVALAFVKRVFDHTPATLDSFSSGSIFGLHIPETGGALYLHAYPVDFPFGFDLAEQSRESFRAESFGPGAVVESDGLQVTFLNPYEGVYTVTIIRAVKKGYSAAGVAIGDSEETLLEQWRGKSLKKLSSISYDDEAWFGECNLAYTYTPEESTKSLLFLIKEGMVSGIELINGLDGAMY